MSDIIFRPAVPSDTSRIKELMLKALKSDPTAFSVSFSEYSDKSSLWWNDYIGSFVYKNNQEMILAFDGDILVGFVGIIFDGRERKKHVATIVWFFVEVGSRGLGIGKTLMDQIILVAKNNRIEKLSLMVCENQKTAIQIYKNYGFDEAGILQKEIKIDEKFYNIFILEHFLA